MEDAGASVSGSFAAEAVHDVRYLGHKNFFQHKIATDSTEVFGL
jgi:hypothetical protein